MEEIDVISLVVDALFELSSAENMVDIVDKEIAAVASGRLLAREGDGLSKISSAVVKIITDNKADKIISQLPEQYKKLSASEQKRLVINIIARDELPESVKEKIRRSVPGLYKSSVIYSTNPSVANVDVAVGWQDISLSTVSVSTSYAKAFVNLAKAFGSLEGAVKEIRSFSKFYESNFNIQQFLNSINISPHDKFECISVLLSGQGISNLTTTFLWLLIMQKKQDLLPSIIRDMERIIYENENSVVLDIYTAYELGINEKQEILNKICDRVGCKAIADFIVERNLIGGIKIQFGYRIYDNSIMARLRKVSKELGKQEIEVA